MGKYPLWVPLRAHVASVLRTESRRTLTAGMRMQGDGTGPDIWKSAKFVLDQAVEKAYGGKRKLEWLEVLAGEKAFNKTGQWLPAETLDTFRKYLARSPSNRDLHLASPCESQSAAYPVPICVDIF